MMPVDNSVYSKILMEFSKEKKQVERVQKEKARQAIVTTKKNIEEINKEITFNIMSKKPIVEKPVEKEPELFVTEEESKWANEYLVEQGVDRKKN